MNGKRIVQIVKTLDGALWAVQQVKCLVDLGWEVHVIAPKLEGRYHAVWLKTGAILHAIPCEFPVKNPLKLGFIKAQLREAIIKINPLIVHSHFVSTTLMMRYALKDLPVKRIFQVPGPLHLEHRSFGHWDTMWADKNDYWIASSRFIQHLYTDIYGISKDRVFLSYYGTDLKDFETSGQSHLRSKYRIPQDAIVIGNVSFIYPPKYYLGQNVGLKGHELMIDAIDKLMQNNPRLWAVFVGQQWGKSQSYFEKIKNEALKKSDRFIFTGYIPQKEIVNLWKEFNLALHIPSSENCGGVVEPMLNGVPTVACKTGGLPEVVIDGQTGYLTPERSIKGVAETIERVLLHPDEAKMIAQTGKKLVSAMFDVKRTANEISDIYLNILGNKNERPDFKPQKIIG